MVRYMIKKCDRGGVWWAFCFSVFLGGAFWLFFGLFLLFFSLFFFLFFSGFLVFSFFPP